MSTQIDMHSAVKQFALVYTPDPNSYQDGSGMPPPTTIGTLYCYYSVHAADNIANSACLRSYIVSCRQRFVINNPTTPGTNLPLSLQSGGVGMVANPTQPNLYANLSGVNLEEQSKMTGYYFYPVWAMHAISWSISGGAIQQAWLLDYQPRTLNSTVNLSSSSGSAASGGNAQNYSNVLQKTSGSANTTTQSYDVSLSIGNLSGLSAAASWGAAHTLDRSRSRSSESGRSTQASSSAQHLHNDSMTIKDWGIYSCVNVAPSGASHCAIPSCTWFLSQEYPYNFLSTNTAANLNGANPRFPYDLSLSSAEIANVFPQNFNSYTTSYQIAPPTELAILGGDFVQTSSWQIDTAYSQDGAPIMTPTHMVDAMFASHFSSNPANRGLVSVVGQFNPNQTTTLTGPSLDLSLLALNPITGNSATNGAIVGFLPNKFLVPVTQGALSRSVSSANNLMVLTQGFTPTKNARPGNNSALAAALELAEFSAQITVCFKLTSAVSELNLYLKHWVGAHEKGCTLSIWFNPTGYAPTHTGAPGEIPPDALVSLNTTEGTGGDNNLLVVNLRNTYFDTVDYHDYLLPGINVIVIGINATTNESNYSIRTIAIGS